MQYTQLFTKTTKNAPADESSKNAELLIRAGYIHKEQAGVYSLLPLGLRVINNIKRVISDEMEKLGSSELIMSSLQSREVWDKTDRWDDDKVDIWFKTKLKNDTEIGLGWSHEEPITNMMRNHINSYKDLPVYTHQFQNKMRNETRAKAGVMRCREFIMKDMYSYSVDEQEHMRFYNKTIDAYLNVYKSLGLGDITYVTSASGGVFTDKFSHEFQTICEAGEDVTYVHKDNKQAINLEVFNDETLDKLNLNKEDFVRHVTAEVGNIFTFGTGKCEQMGLYYKNENDESVPVYLGSYGIGVTRLLGVLAEINGDDKGLSWPAIVSPYAMHIVSLHKVEGDEVYNYAKNIYDKLRSKGVEVLWDDRSGVGAGEKFADVDLIGITQRVLVSDKTLKVNSVEIKERKSDTSELIHTDDFLSAYTKANCE
jgi:prolyl-tRNA synthetase